MNLIVVPHSVGYLEFPMSLLGSLPKPYFKISPLSILIMRKPKTIQGFSLQLCILDIHIFFGVVVRCYGKLLTL